MSIHEQQPASDPDPAPARSRGPATFGLIGLGVGFVLGVALIWGLGGNPFSSANEVVYRDVVVASVTGQADQLCWSDDPERRDAAQTCAILALDPELEVPEVGDLVTIGVVELRPPDGAETQQVVHVGPADAGDAPAGTDVGEPTPAATP